MRTGLDFDKIPTGSDMDVQTALITAVQCLNRVFFGYKPDWIKYLDSVTGLGSDWITHLKCWTGLGSQKSSIRSTLLKKTFNSGLQPLTCWDPFVAATMMCRLELTKERVEPTILNIIAIEITMSSGIPI